MLRSFEPSCRKTRSGLGSVLRTSVEYECPPRRPTYVPIVLNTRRKASGRSQATLKAQIAPELAPPIPRRLGSLVRFRPLPTSGRISSSRKRA